MILCNRHRSMSGSWTALVLVLSTAMHSVEVDAAGSSMRRDPPPPSVPRAAITSLAGMNLRCVDFGVTFTNSSLSPWNTSLPYVWQISMLGDGFSRVKNSSVAVQYAFSSISLFLNPRARALLQAPADTAIPVAASDLDGVNIWLLNQLASAGNFTIDYFIYKLPVGLQGVADSSAILSYLLSTKGYDCVTTGVQVTAARSALVNFLVPTEPFGYVAVTGLNFRAFVIAKIEDDVKSWVKNLFFWVVPFSNGVWHLLFVSLTVVGFVMCLLERGKNEENFAKEKMKGLGGWIEALWNGVYYAFAGFVTKTEEFAPKTLAGRCLGLANAFAVFLYIALYVANLTAILTSQTTAVSTVNVQQALLSSPITSLNSYVGTKYRPCTQTEVGVQGFMKTLYPTVNYYPVPAAVAATIPDFLFATQWRECGDGTILPSKQVEYWTSVAADPDGYFCGVEVEGAIVPDPSSSAYAVAFSLATSLNTIDALNALTSDLVSGSHLNSTYALGTGTVNFPTFTANRPQCSHYPPPSPPISKRREMPAPPAPVAQGQALVTFSGVFIVQAIGIVAGLFLWMFEKSVISCGTCLIDCFESVFGEVREKIGLPPKQLPRAETMKLADGDGDEGYTNGHARPPRPSGWFARKSTLRREVQADVLQWGLTPSEQVRVLRELASKLEKDIEGGGEEMPQGPRANGVPPLQQMQNGEETQRGPRPSEAQPFSPRAPESYQPQWQNEPRVATAQRLPQQQNGPFATEAPQEPLWSGAPRAPEQPPPAPPLQHQWNPDPVDEGRSQAPAKYDEPPPWRPAEPDSTITEPPSQMAPPFVSATSAEEVSPRYPAQPAQRSASGARYSAQHLAQPASPRGEGSGKPTAWNVLRKF